MKFYSIRNWRTKGIETWDGHESTECGHAFAVDSSGCFNRYERIGRGVFRSHAEAESAVVCAARAEVAKLEKQVKAIRSVWL